MKVFKNTYTKNKNGVRVTMKANKYYGRLKKATGETVKIPLVADKHLSQTMLAKLQLVQDQIKSGVLLPHGVKEKKSLLAYVDLFAEHLARKNSKSKAWSQEQKSKLKLVFGCGTFVYHTDVTKDSLVDVLDKLRVERGWSNQTFNHYVKTLNAFFNWLINEDFILKKPYKKIELKDTGKENLVHGRRAFSNEEFNFLIESVENDKSTRHSKISKVDRINLYLIAIFTGLRAEELYQLKPECFDFSSCTITFIAGKTRKNKGRYDVLPLHPELVLKIKDWVFAKEKNKMLWNCWDSQYFGTLLKKDMFKARVLYISCAITDDEKKIREQDDFLKWEDSNSLFADLHSLRTTFISNVSKVASPKQCQMLARHTDIKTTFNYYVKISDSELANVVGKLPTFK